MELSKLVKGCVKMFEVGERVVYGHHGVCEIVKIDTLDMPNVPKDRRIIICRRRQMAPASCMRRLTIPNFPFAGL